MSRPGTLVVKGPALLLGEQFLPIIVLFTAPPAFADRRKILIRMCRPKNQSREKQMLGTQRVGLGSVQALPWPGRGGRGPPPCTAEVLWVLLQHGGPNGPCDFLRCSQFCFFCLHEKHVISEHALAEHDSLPSEHG